MQKIYRIISGALLVLVILAILFAVIVRLSFRDHREQLPDYLLCTNCTDEDLDFFMQQQDISSFSEVCQRAEDIVVATYHGSCEIFTSGIQYTLSVDDVLSGDVKPEDEIQILSFDVVDNKNCNITTLYGNVPFLEGETYLLFLNEKEQFTAGAETVYYITTESPFGKYLLDGTIAFGNESYGALSTYQGVSFVTDSVKVQRFFETFYHEAMEYLK